MSEAPSCPDNETPAPDRRLGALYWACVRNDCAQLQAVLDDGVSPEEAAQVDGNGRVSHPRASQGSSGSGHTTLLLRLPGASGRRERARAVSPAGYLWGSVGQRARGARSSGEHRLSGPSPRQASWLPATAASGAWWPCSAAARSWT